MKKLLCGIVSLLFTAGVCFAAEAPSLWAQEDFARAQQAGVVPAALDSSYSAPITRAEFCALIAGLVQKWDGEGLLLVALADASEASFSDSDAEAVRFCAANGIVDGVGNGKFAPSAQIERQAAAKILRGAAAFAAQAENANLTDADMPHLFSDGADLRAWARDSVNWAYRAGVAAGVGENRFAPTDTYTREQAVLTVLRLYQLAAAPDKLNKPETDYYPLGDLSYAGRIPGWYGSDCKLHSIEELGCVYPLGAPYGIGGQYGGTGTSSVCVYDRNGNRMLTDFKGSKGYFYDVDFYGDWVSVMRGVGDESDWHSAMINLKTGETLNNMQLESTVFGDSLGSAQVLDANGPRYRLFTKTGKTDLYFEQLYPAQDGKRIAWKDAAYFIINERDGSIVSQIKLPKGTEFVYAYGSEMVVKKDGKQAFFNGKSISNAGFTGDYITISPHGSATYISGNNGHYTLYRKDGEKLCGPYPNLLIEAGRDIYARWLSDTQYEYFRCVSPENRKVIATVDVTNGIPSALATDGAGLYALATASDTIMLLDRFGDTVALIHPQFAVNDRTMLSFRNGLLCVSTWTENYAVLEKWFTPNGKQVPVPLLSRLEG